MALTPAQKQRAYRERLKEKGGKSFAINLQGKLADWVKAGSDATGKTQSEVLGDIVQAAFARYMAVSELAAVIPKAGGTDEQMSRFLKDNTNPEISNPLDYVELKN